VSLNARPAEVCLLSGVVKTFSVGPELDEFAQILRGGYRVGVGTRTLRMSVHHPPAAPGKNFGRAYVKVKDAASGAGTTRAFTVLRACFG
jgi:hypothetical protein